MHNMGCPVPVVIIPNGHRPQQRFGAVQRNRILVVSRLFPRKGVQHFIDAVAGMDSDWEMIVAGDGPYREELEAHARSVAPKVRFMGMVGPEALRLLYESARILVFPSIQENFPMVLLEAMDAGCAVVTTNAEGCAEVVGTAGIVVPKGEPEGIRKALERLMRDPGLVQQLSARSQARAATLAWSQIVPRYRDLLQAAITKDPDALRRAAARAQSASQPKS